MAQLLDGNVAAQAVRADVRRAVRQWTDAGHRPPFLSVVLVGEDPASASYVRGKTRDAEEIGIGSETLTYDADLPEVRLLELIDELNANDAVDGILVQLPLPDHIDAQQVIRAIVPHKDVDGFHPVNIGRLVLGQEALVPATPSGILELLRRYEIDVAGRHAVIVGRSNIVGKPLANLLLQRGADATVTVCHSRTRDLAARTREADLLVAAVGRPALITADMVKDGAVVIDVGISRVEDASRERGYRLAGDVDFEAVREKASWVTPVPGGVGPMTRALMLKNTLQCAMSNE